MATWVVGDIHGCAAELAELLGRLALKPDDRLVSVGDLFHRGPDAMGVVRALRQARASFVLGNHEHVLLRRLGLLPTTLDGRERPPARSLPELSEHDLQGDGRRPLAVAREDRQTLLSFLQTYAGYFLEHTSIEGAGTTPDGRAWCVVHAGRTAGREVSDSRVRDLIYPARVAGRGSPMWFEAYEGPKLVLYGHLPAEAPRVRRVDGRLVALGLDTGCVYGGALTAYSPELDRFHAVKARHAYVKNPRYLRRS